VGEGAKEVVDPVRRPAPFGAVAPLQSVLLRSARGSGRAVFWCGSAAWLTEELKKGVSGGEFTE